MSYILLCKTFLLRLFAMLCSFGLLSCASALLYSLFNKTTCCFTSAYAFRTLSLLLLLHLLMLLLYRGIRSLHGQILRIQCRLFWLFEQLLPQQLLLLQYFRRLKVFLSNLYRLKMQMPKLHGFHHQSIIMLILLCLFCTNGFLSFCLIILFYPFFCPNLLEKPLQEFIWAFMLECLVYILAYFC